MLALLLLVGSIALADALNPTTVLPAVYFATQARAVPRIAAFALGVFSVSFVFGVAIVLGPGQLLLNAFPHVDARAKHWIELGVGIALLVIAVALWTQGGRLSRRVPTGSEGGRRSAFVLGAAIMAVELPTAFPYFAALAAIIGSDRSITLQIALTAWFNVLFIAPVLVILALRVNATPGARRRLARLGAWIRRSGHEAVAALAGLAGAAFAVVGLAGVA